MRQLTILMVVALLGAGEARAGRVKYVHGADGRLAGRFENGVAIAYTYDAAGNVTRRNVCQGACFIGGDCWDEAEVNPTNVCQACTAATDDVAWTGRAGLTCDDGDPATVDDVCSSAGVCAGVVPPPPGGGGGDGGCCRVHGQPPAAPRGTLLLGAAAAALVFVWRRKRGSRR